MSDTSTIPINQLIDHALLHPTLTDQDIRQGCELARRLEVASVCVKPYAIRLAADVLRNSSVAVGTVIGFPHGSATSEIKAAEAEQACLEGAVELDMVVNIGKVLQGDWEFVEQDIAGVVEVAQRHHALVKVILETDLITSEGDKRRLCQLSERLGAAYVKTSTGFGFVKQASGQYAYKGATEADVRLMRESCGEVVGVKASGGIRSIEDAERFRALGATRLGTSASESIIAGSSKDSAGY